MSNLPSQTKILIVGAGPAGLTTAISLVKHGVLSQDITMVDCVLNGENSSRATIIHAGTLEALDSIGCVEDIISIGIRGNGEHFVDRHGSPIVTSSFSVLAPYTKYPFFIAISQAITEKILLIHAQSLGIIIHRPFKVVSMTPSTLGSGLNVTLDDGQVITTRYVIGADGAKSVIRESAGIKFSDPDGRSADESVDKTIAQMIMADVTFTPHHPPRITQDILAITPSDKGLFLILPLDNETAKMYGSEEPIYRIGFTVPLEKGAPPSHPSAEVIEEYIRNQGPYHLSSEDSSEGSVRIGKVHWSSRFRLRSAIADTFFKKIDGDKVEGGGLVFLVGDAAHIHPPSGGQGMNLGIRDSIGLGMVLAEHMKKYDGDMDAYDEEGIKKLEAFAASRREGALKVINLTKVLIRAATGVMTNKVVAWGLRMASMVPLFQRSAVWNLSGLGDKIVTEGKPV